MVKPSRVGIALGLDGTKNNPTFDAMVYEDKPNLGSCTRRNL